MKKYIFLLILVLLCGCAGGFKEDNDLLIPDAFRPEYQKIQNK